METLQPGLVRLDGIGNREWRREADSARRYTLYPVTAEAAGWGFVDEVTMTTADGQTVMAAILCLTELVISRTLFRSGLGSM